MSSVIKVENLSKKYVLNHQKREPYTALRDEITNGAMGILGMFYGKKNPRNLMSQEDFWALKDVSFEIKQGDKVGIIGRNGAGKSTLLKIISRITEPTSGKISITGRVASLLEVGTGFHPELTGRENIYLNGAILGMSKFEIKSKFDEIVAFADVERFLDTPVKRYSSGMYVRLAFSVAAHLEPEILVIDEVLAVGDAQFQKKCMGKMQQAGGEGRTVLFVSHNMAAIRTLCTNVISMHRGKILNSGLATKVVEDYLGMGLSYQLEQSWPDFDTAPGSDQIRLSSLRVVSKENAASNLTIRKPFSIEFTYTLLHKETFFYIGFHFKTISGECIFVTASSPKKMSSGTYSSICNIPGNLLNDGIYTIHVYFVKDRNNVLLEIENSLTFEVYDIEREDGSWIGDFPGAVRPQFQWNTINAK